MIISKKNIKRYKKVGYSLDIMRYFECLVIKLTQSRFIVKVSSLHDDESGLRLNDDSEVKL